MILKSESRNIHNRNMTVEEIRARIENQMSVTEKIKKADETPSAFLLFYNNYLSFLHVLKT